MPWKIVSAWALETHREESLFGNRLMKAESASGDHVAEAHPGDPLYQDLQIRGWNRRFVGTPDRVFIVDDTDQVVHAVDAMYATQKQKARKP